MGSASVPPSSDTSPPARSAALPCFAAASDTRMGPVIAVRTSLEEEVNTDDKRRFSYSKGVNGFVLLIFTDGLTHWLVLGHRKYLR